jgi:multidrug resistance efflux pump
MFSRYVLPLAAVALLLWAVLHTVRAEHKPPKLEPPVAPPRAPAGTAVAGAGIVEPETENISVGAVVPGVVTEVLVHVGDSVRKGTPLFRLDRRHLDAERHFRQANLESAQAQLERLKSQPREEEKPPSQARVEEARANLEDQEDQLRRSRALFAQQAIGSEELVRRQQAAAVARAQYDRARAEHKLLLAGAWMRDLKVAEMSVSLAEAQLKQTEVEIDRLEVRALVDGQVLQVNVRPGEYVGAPPGQALVVLGNVDRLHVRVDIDEHDIPRFQPGEPARAMLRGDPSQTFELEFIRVEPYVIPKKSLTGDNTERVDTRVLQVIYHIKSTGQQLFVGQQVDVYVGGKGAS